MTGCGSGHDERAKFSYVDEHGNWNGRTEPPSASAEGTGDDSDVAYLTTVRALAPSLESQSDDGLTSLGRTICESFAAGYSSGEIGQMVMKDSGFDVTEAAVLVGAAPSNYFPKYTSQVDGSG